MPIKRTKLTFAPYVLLIIGVVGLLFALFAPDILASNTRPAVTADFSSRDIVVGLISLVMVISGAYIAGFRNDVNRRVTANERDISAHRQAQQELRELVLRDYHNKEDVMAQFRELRDTVNAVHRRLDSLHVPHVQQ